MADGMEVGASERGRHRSHGEDKCRSRLVFHNGSLTSTKWSPENEANPLRVMLSQRPEQPRLTMLPPPLNIHTQEPELPTHALLEHMLQPYPDGSTGRLAFLLTHLRLIK